MADFSSWRAKPGGLLSLQNQEDGTVASAGRLGDELSAPLCCSPSQWSTGASRAACMLNPWAGLGSIDGTDTRITPPGTSPSVEKHSSLGLTLYQHNNCSAIRMV
jgi:hypothetical protein